MPPVAVIPPSPKRTMPSIQITLTNEENERLVTSNRSQVSKSISNPNEKPSIQSTRKIVVGGGSSSAFRPFLKQPSLNAMTLSKAIPTHNVKPSVINTQK